MSNNIKIWIIHYTKLIDRKEFIEQQLNNYSFKYEFIEEYDWEKLKKEQLKLFNIKKLKLPTISLFYKHIHTYKKIINSVFKYNLIFEDDVIMENNFEQKLNKTLMEFPNNFDMIFIGDGCNLHIPKKDQEPNKLIYKKCNEITKLGGHGATRCTDSYFISKNCALKILNHIKNFKNFSIDLPLDYWLNNIIRELNLNIYWLEPTIITQGSQIGKFKSSH